MVNGGSLLTLLPVLELSSNCFVSSRVCAANASSGESAGGTSPARCIRGDFSGRAKLAREVDESALRSMKVGRCAIVKAGVFSEPQNRLVAAIGSRRVQS